jgi:hypothetical protein
VLGLKALGLPGLDVLSFDFLDPPEQVRPCEIYMLYSVEI